MKYIQNRCLLNLAIFINPANCLIKCERIMISFQHRLQFSLSDCFDPEPIYFNCIFVLHTKRNRLSSHKFVFKDVKDKQKNERIYKHIDTYRHKQTHIDTHRHKKYQYRQSSQGTIIYQINLCKAVSSEAQIKCELFYDQWASHGTSPFSLHVISQEIIFVSKSPLNLNSCVHI